MRARLRGLFAAIRTLATCVKRMVLAAWRRPLLTSAAAFVVLLAASSGQATFTTINSALLDSAPFGGNHVSMHYGDESGPRCRNVIATAQQTADVTGDQRHCAGRVAVAPRSAHAAPVHAGTIASAKTQIYKQSDLARLELKELAKVRVQICGAAAADPRTLVVQTKGMSLRQLVAVAGVKFSAQSKEVRVQYLLKTDAPNKLTGEVK